MGCFSNKRSSTCFEEWMTYIRENLKKSCDPKMPWTVWNSVSLDKSGPVVNKIR